MKRAPLDFVCPAASTSVVKSPKIKVGLQNMHLPLWNVVLFQLSSVIPHCDIVAVIHLPPADICLFFPAYCCL
jgi:hypothetical protein